MSHRIARTSAVLLVALAACGDPTDAPEEHGQSHDAATSHCFSGFEPDPRDATMSGEETVLELEDGQRDVVLPDEVLDWITEHGWRQQHDDWHKIRRVDIACRRAGATDENCTYAQKLAERGLERAPIQEGQRGDGYAFMAMHRHMIRGLQQAFPKHKALFGGFEHVPMGQDDSQNPMPWRDVVWSPAQLRSIDRLEHIEDHMDEFPTEDSLAGYIQHPHHWTVDKPSVVNEDPTSGFHGAMHAQWSIPGSPALLGVNDNAVSNAVFWKLHGWIDKVWERYRKAADIGEDDPTYQRELIAQCLEMHSLDDRMQQPLEGKDDPEVVAPTDSFFDVEVRPALARKCGGCHNADSPTAGLTLADPQRTAAQLLESIVGSQATNEEYVLIEPGAPERSWLYLKASGEVEQATCEVACNRERMPPAGDKLDTDELAALKRWIVEGATP